jgi:hypothetical protein
MKRHTVDSIPKKRKPNKKRLAEDEADYRFSQKSIRSGRAIALSKVLRELGYRVERTTDAAGSARTEAAR